MMGRFRVLRNEVMIGLRTFHLEPDTEPRLQKNSTCLYYSAVQRPSNLKN